jgi:hypothetical protein
LLIIGLHGHLKCTAAHSEKARVHKNTVWQRGWKFGKFGERFRRVFVLKYRHIDGDFPAMSGFDVFDCRPIPVQ